MKMEQATETRNQKLASYFFQALALNMGKNYLLKELIWRILQTTSHWLLFLGDV